MAEGRDIDETQSLRIAELFLAFIVITLLFEKLTGYLDKNLKGRTRRGLRHAVHHIEEELLALGLISLLLIVAEEYLLKICVENDGYVSGSKKGKGARRRLSSRRLLAGGDENGSCEKDEEPFWSAQTIHQTHIFIFLIAVIHVLYATASILMCLWRMYRWRRFENQPGHALKQLKNARLVYGQNTFEYWFWSFWAQFSPAVDESLYLSMRCLFIERMGFPEDFDFLSFAVNSLVEEFSIVVRTDWLTWVIAAVWILVPDFIMITTAAAVIVVLVAGTKLEVIGVKLTQLAYLAYGDRRSIGEERGAPVESFFRFPERRKETTSFGDAELVEYLQQDPEDLVRRAQSFENRRKVSFGQELEKQVSLALSQQEIESHDQQTPKSEAPASPKKGHKRTSRLSCFGSLTEGLHPGKQFAENYNLPDSANLFWFKKPQLILRALRFVYFETAMAIAVVCFDSWQSSEFIIKDTHYFGNKFSLVTALIIVGVLCLLHTSFLMLPTYALTMVAGSHCPETVLKMAKKMKIETAQVSRIESLGEKSMQSQMDMLNKPLSITDKGVQDDQADPYDTSEKAISSLVGAMYRGRLQRLIKQKSANPEAVARSLESAGPEDERTKDSPGNGAAAVELDRDGQSSYENSAVDDEEQRGIAVVFGSFERFLDDLRRAQEGIKQTSPAANFNFDCSTGSYDGRESTRFDRAAINLTWDLMAALQDVIAHDPYSAHVDG